MVCTAHRLQCITPHFPKHIFPIHATRNVQTHLKPSCEVHREIVFSLLWRLNYSEHLHGTYSKVPFILTRPLLERFLCSDIPFPNILETFTYTGASSLCCIAQGGIKEGVANIGSTLSTPSPAEGVSFLAPGGLDMATPILLRPMK